MRGVPTSTVLQVLELVSPVEWGRFATGSGPDGPAAPLIVWRFDGEPDWAAAALERAVDTFAGRFEWVIEKPGRNWVLWPEREKQEFENGSWRTDSEYRVALAGEDPQFCDSATRDLSDLLQHIERVLESPLGQQEE